MNVFDQIQRDEGLRLTMYQDSVGVPTIGYGHNLNRAISRAAAAQILLDDVADTVQDLDSLIPWWSSLSMPRQAVLVNMAFNLGIAGLCGFHNFLLAAHSGKFAEAAAHMLDSKWATQVGERAQRLAKQMETDQWV